MPNKYNGVLGLSHSDWDALIDEWILHKRNREIMKARLLDGLTYEKIAENFDMSERQIKKIVKQELQNLTDIVIERKIH